MILPKRAGNLIISEGSQGFRYQGDKMLYLLSPDNDLRAKDLAGVAHSVYCHILTIALICHNQGDPNAKLRISAL